MPSVTVREWFVRSFGGDLNYALHVFRPLVHPYVWFINLSGLLTCPVCTWQFSGTARRDIPHRPSSSQPMESCDVNNSRLFWRTAQCVTIIPRILRYARAANVVFRCIPRLTVRQDITLIIVDPCHELLVFLHYNLGFFFLWEEIATIRKVGPAALISVCGQGS